MDGTAPHEIAVRRGDVLAGRYEVERVLGQGGMGVVVAAKHRDLRQRVALKFMLPGAAQTPGAKERFLREARAAVQLKSEHVARVLDVGTFNQHAGGESPYIVMEFLEGRDLGEILDRAGAMSVERAVEYVLHACEALGEAHALGIIHRDLKPANLFLTCKADGSPCIKVLDFGISKVTRDTQLDKSITRTNAAMGTPHYMSPEQARSAKDVDRRTDIWALGVILYELLTQQVPFDGESVAELIAKVLETTPRPLLECNDDLPPDLAVVVMRCLEKDPELRWPGIADFAMALAPFAPERARDYSERVSRVMQRASSMSDAVLGETEPAGGAPRTTTNAVWRSDPEPRGSNVVLIAVAGVIVVLILIGGFFANRSDAPVPEPAASTNSPPSQDEDVTAAERPEPASAPVDASPVNPEPTAIESARAQAPATTTAAAASASPSVAQPVPKLRPPVGQPTPSAEKPDKPAYCFTPDAFFTDDDGIKKRRPECR